MRDTGEIALANVLIKDLATGFTVFTNAFGVYALPLDDPNVQMEASIAQGQWENPIITRSFLTEESCKQNVDFGFIPEGNDPKVNISVANTITRCDFETKFFITVENLDHDPIEGEVEFVFDELTTFFNSDIPSLQINGNKATFETGVLDGFSPKTFTITLKMPGGSSTLPVLTFEARIFVDNELFDTYAYTQELRCSYDPNDKRTFPDRAGDENLTLKNEDIDYTIRFQNNGNDTAFHVRIVDVLDPAIIKSSIRFLGGSHPYDACISEDSLFVDFNGIRLVDSTTNYEQSQGYVSFTCSVDTNIIRPFELFNTADIIFDTNEPIVTNTTLNTIVDKLCTDTIVQIEKIICEGETFMGYEFPGNYIDTIPSAFGCDSIVNLDLDVVPVSIIELDFNLCGPLDSVVIGDLVLFFDSTGIYEQEVFGTSGCIEKLYILDVVVTHPEIVDLAIIICEGDSIFYQGEYLQIDSSGIFSFDFIGESNCIETTLNVDATIIEVEEQYLSLDICEGEEIIIDDTNYAFDSSGIYTYLIVGPSDCNEIELTIDVFINPTISIETDTVICEGQDYQGYDESGTYTIETTDPITGCSIIETLTLTVLPESDPNCIVNTEEVSLPNIKVFPIPARDILFLESNQGISNISISSTTGVLITNYEYQGDKNVSLDISSIPQGIYLIIVETMGIRTVKRFIVSE